jgi:glucokinase
MFLGIEIGGTKLQLGVGPGDGSIVGLWRGAVDVEAGPEGIRHQITAAVPELLDPFGLARGQIQGVGIGFGGPVDDATRTIIKSHQIEGWDNFPLAGWITDMLGLPTVLGNDADVAGLAEALFGAGKGLSPIFYITIGSGIGGGLIINGEIYRGCGRGAAEIGHLMVSPEWAMAAAFPERFVPVSDSGMSPLEELASGWAIQRRAIQSAVSSRGSAAGLLRLAGGQAHSITAAHVAQAATRGDEFANSILETALACLAQAIRQVVTLVCPRRVIIGGGVSLMGERLLFGPLRRMLATQIFPPFADCYEIVPAAMGEGVVVHGALALARRRLNGGAS